MSPSPLNSGGNKKRRRSGGRSKTLKANWSQEETVVFLVEDIGCTSRRHSFRRHGRVPSLLRFVPGDGVLCAPCGHGLGQPGRLFVQRPRDPGPDKAFVSAGHGARLVARLGARLEIAFQSAIFPQRFDGQSEGRR